MSRPDAPPPGELARLEARYRARFGHEPPVFFMPEPLGIEVLRQALARDEPAPPEAWPQPGCNCA